MSVIRWPALFNEQGRLPEGEAAWATGKSALMEGTPGCPQTLRVNLFFGGTNYNREWDSKHEKRPMHGNVAQLFNACSDQHEMRCIR